MDPIFTFNINPVFMAVFLGAAASAALDYAPKLAAWYDKRTVAEKRWIYAVSVTALVGLSFAGDCYGLFATNLVCTTRGGVDAVGVVLTALGIGNGLHNQTKPSAETKEKLGIT